MDISIENIFDVLREYGIKSTIRNTSYLIESYGKDIIPRVKVIVKVEMNSEETYIVKFILEEEHPQQLIEEQSVFSELMRENGINTPKRFKCGDRYCILFYASGLTYAVTVEEYLGEELEFINYKMIEEIACLMANMHIISQNNNCHINGSTIWDLFDGTSDISRGYKAFCEYRNSEKYDFNAYDIDLYNKIIDLYEQRIFRLREMWYKLPRYATQGDYSINNLVYKNGKIGGIFDYNIAGDEVLVSEMIIEGLFVSYEMDLDNVLTDDDKDKMFRAFVRKYKHSRELSRDEVNVMNDIYAVVFPFWWTRIIFDEEKSLLKYLEDNNVEKVNKFLNETYGLLSQNYFSDQF